MVGCCILPWSAASVHALRLQWLYSSQTIVYSKLKAQYINVRTNAYHAGETVAPFQQGGGEETERD